MCWRLFYQYVVVVVLFVRVCCCFGILSVCCGVGSPYPIKKEGGGGALLPFSTQKLKKVIEKVAKRVDKGGFFVVEWVVKRWRWAVMFACA